MDEPPVYYKLTEVEQLFRVSRDTVTRLERAGLLQVHGRNQGRLAVGTFVRALRARIEEDGEDLWEILRAAEAKAGAGASVGSAPSTAGGPSSTTNAVPPTHGAGRRRRGQTASGTAEEPFLRARPQRLHELRGKKS